jgi:23S rRNA (adenine2030-N6)-methyltransferase
MTAAGLLVINPPWQLDQEAEEVVGCLGGCLDQGGGFVRVGWEVCE